MSAPAPWAEPGLVSATEAVWHYVPAHERSVVLKEKRPVTDASKAEGGGFAQFWAAVNAAFSSEGELVVTRLPPRRTWLELRVIFEELASKWRHETAMEALPSRKAMNFSYQSIIGMGPDALPFILESLAAEVDDWFWALTAITRKNVAAGTSTTKDAVAAWLEWGKAERYVA
jgi:hypothetical protein